MSPRLLLTMAFALLVTVSPASAQTSVEEAREQGKAMAQEKRNDSTLVPTDDAQAQAVPGYSGTDLPETSLYDDPDKLVSEGSAMTRTNDAFKTVTNQAGTRPTFSDDEILATTNRATGVEGDPNAFLEGEALSASSGSCKPLPPSVGSSGYYEATCNQGTKIEDQLQSCSIRMVPTTKTVDAYKFFVVPDSAYGTPFARAAAMVPHVASGVCKPTGVVMRACAAHIIYGVDTNKFCNGYNATEYVCSQNLTDLSYLPSPITGQGWHAKTTETTVTTARVDSCGGLAGDTMCAAEPTGEVCTEGPETRVIDGVPVTQACWAWKRDFTCHVMTPANDCGDLEKNATCSYLRTECLDEEPSAECKVSEKVYRCPTPDAPTGNAPQYICGDDVYCVNGDCEPIVREASTEFKDALVALHAIGQAGDEFDPNNFTVFKGERDTCHKPVFGLVNCCAGKVSGALTATAGLAALAGGPAAIAALATPFLALALCSSNEMQLDIKDRMGFCHKVGTYCSDSFLGVCTSKSTAYCCFESKLSRVLQEQGRPQIGKGWDAPKKEQCKGFTIDEFAQLDLSKMDFTEVYKEFMDAAKLPDEVQTMSDIQGKIQDYYDLHGK